MSLLDDIGGFFGGIGSGVANAVSGGANAVASVPGDVESGVKDASSLVSDAGTAISSVGDFLSYIAWIFHPLNILRVVEFIAGFNLMLAGLYLLTRRGSSGRTSSPVVRRAIQATPAGKVIRVQQGTRMGRYEGQREAARMTARQAETRLAREASAVEREQINVNARRAAREQ